MAVLCLVGFAVPGSMRAGIEHERRLSLYNIHNGERLDIVYKRDGVFVPEALTKLNWIFRDWRRNEATRMDPAAFDILWEIYQELGSRQPVHIISGYRAPGTNEKLRRSGGGQAKNSQHIEGKALDIHFPDVPVQRLRYSALIRERGGVGYYPTSALPFVHIDTGRVRMWPRMPRHELALLFPNGRSKYVPADGRPITPADVAQSRQRYATLAATVAAFHQFRAKPKDQVLVASLEQAETQIVPPAPKLTAAAKKIVAAPSLQVASLVDLVPPAPRLATSADLANGKLAETRRLSEADQKRLDALTAAALATPAPATTAKRKKKAVQVASAENVIVPPKPTLTSQDAFISKTGWATAPEYDEEHDDELSYRPFPIAPFLTPEASLDSPIFVALRHPDLESAHSAIATSDGAVIKLRFKQGLQFAELLWADRFSGEDVTTVLSAEASDQTGPAGGRKVKTASRK